MGDERMRQITAEDVAHIRRKSIGLLKEEFAILKDAPIDALLDEMIKRANTDTRIRRLQGLLTLRLCQRNKAAAAVEGIRRRLSELTARREREERGDYSDMVRERQQQEEVARAF
jgi:hypothetical protein